MREADVQAGLLSEDKDREPVTEHRVIGLHLHLQTAPCTLVAPTTVLNNTLKCLRYPSYLHVLYFGVVGASRTSHSIV